MGYPKNLIPEPVRRVAFGGITAVFADLGTPFTKPIRILHFKNTTNQTAEITVDGTNVNFEIPANSFDLYDISANRTPEEMALFREGIQLQVRRPSSEIDPTSGAVIVQIWIGET